MQEKEKFRFERKISPNGKPALGYYILLDYYTIFQTMAV
jgi:hypothetical protein